MAKASEATQALFRRKARLTLPLLSMAHTNQLYVGVLAPMVHPVMPQLAKSEDGRVTLCRVMDLETGEYANLIVPAVVQSTWEQAGDYVGKCYELVSTGIADGKDYRAVDVFEVDEPEGFSEHVELPSHADSEVKGEAYGINPEDE